MATYNKYNIFVENLGNKVHDIFGNQDVYKVILSNTAPNAATHAVRADVTELSTGGGYTSGGLDITFNSTRTTGVLTATSVDVTFTAAGGTIGPFRYAILYDDTPTSPADPLVAWWDYGSSITLNDTEFIVIDFGASLFTLT